MKVIIPCIIVCLMLATSCTVVNNLYVNDPVPVGKDSLRAYVGVGSGFIPIIDSISIYGTVFNPNKLKLAPNLCVGGQFGLGKQTDLRIAFNFPYIIAGFGFRAGVQHSFFRKEEPFNLAVGADVGIALSKDSLLGVKLDNIMQDAVNADIFLPMSFSSSPNYRIIFTPRISFNAFYVKENIFLSKTTVYSTFIPSITLGMKLNRIYIECGVHSVHQVLMPNLGICYMFK